MVAVLWASAAASQFAGPDSCRRCHPTQYNTQARSRHALALRPISETPLAQLLAEQPLRERSGISFEYQPVPGGLLVNVLLGKQRSSALLEWAFGSGAQAFTPVGRIDGRFLEHRISYYTTAPGARRTLGHPGTPSKDPNSALGIPQPPETAFRCFNCHATGVKAGPDLQAMIAGVTCERCHGPAIAHVTRGAAMEPTAKRNRDGVMSLCGECHRLPPPGSSRIPEVDDPLSIRFAPVGLMASACYKGSSDLSCATCHNPHENASRDAAQYIAKCIVCHQQKSCAAGKTGDCLSCHMRRQTPAPYLSFTDHRIRVWPENPSP